MRFSIITSFYCWNDYREKSIKRAIESVEAQTFKGLYEYIIINDGSPRSFEVPKWIKVVNKKHGERVNGYNYGLKKAKGDIICFLDSDDEYAPNYLQRCEDAFRQSSDTKLINFGAHYVDKDGGESDRGAFRPARRKVGHENFGGGTIVNGTYVFHRSVYKDLGGFPKAEIKNIDCSAINYGKGKRNLFMHTPYDFSAAAQMEFPAMREYFMVDHVNEPNKILKELGNPWGQDYYLFYKYTRKYHSTAFDDPLYIVHPKQGVE